jgi:sulfur-oxidizing protein SoxZ
MSRALISVPSKAKKGEVVEIKALIQHVMETGFRPNSTGVILPRDIITQFKCLYNGTEVFSCEMHPAVAANPFLTFHTVATESGMLEFHWAGDNGFSVKESAKIQVE